MPTRVLQGIQTVPRFDNYLNPEILSLIEKDSMFCMTSDNITDTAQLALTIFYNKEMEYLGYRCIIIRYGKQKMFETFYKGSKKDASDSLYYIYEAERPKIEFWIPKIRMDSIIEKPGRIHFYEEFQYYPLFFYYFLIPKTPQNRLNKTSQALRSCQ